jgi:hypothetical protein
MGHQIVQRTKGFIPQITKDCRLTGYFEPTRAFRAASDAAFNAVATSGV